MGFFQNLAQGAKKMMNRVTGGYGKINFLLDKNQVLPGENLQYNINIKSTGELEAKRVMIRLRGISNYTEEVEHYDEEEGCSYWETENCTSTVHEEEYEVHGSLKMKQDEIKKIVGEIKIPVDCQKSYSDIDSGLHWVIEADVDIPWGKDLKQEINIEII